MDYCRLDERHTDLGDLESEIETLRRRLHTYTNPIKVGIEVSNGLCHPLKTTTGSAGYDLKASRDVTLPVGEIVKVPTGVKLRLPSNYEAQVRSRSGLAARGVIVVNSPGTIDSDYRGEVCVLLQSTKRTHEVKEGDRIAQLVFQRVPEVYFEAVKALEIDTARGVGGFGSTGDFEPESAMAAHCQSLEAQYCEVCRQGDCEEHGPAPK